MVGQELVWWQMLERDLAEQLSWKHVVLLGEPATLWLPGERMVDLSNNGVKVYVKYIVRVLKIPA